MSTFNSYLGEMFHNMLAENSNLHGVNSNLREGERRCGNIFRAYMCNVRGEVSRQSSILFVFGATEGFNCFHLEDEQIVTMVVTYAIYNVS